MFYARHPLFFALLLGAALLHGPSRADDVPRPLPGKTVKVFLLAGQSNMEGRADGTKLSEADQARLRTAQERVWLAFNGQPARPLYAYTPSEELQEIYQRPRMFGPELFLGITLAEAWPDEQILLIKRAEGDTSLHGRWNPEWNREKATLMGEADAPPLYEEFMVYTRQVLGAYAEADYTIEAMCWVQGENDSKVPKAAATYGTTLQALIERVRSDTGHKDLPFMFFQLGSAEMAKGMAHVAATVPRVTMIPQHPDSDSPDFYATMRNGHYNRTGMKKLGVRFATEYLSTMRSNDRQHRE